MAENFIQVPANSTGEKVRTFKNTVGPNDVNSEATTIVDKAGNVMADLDGGGRLLVNASGVAVPVTDNGGSLTVDGSVTLLANSGVDVGDVTINNGAGAGAVNIQDGGNSITVDGTVTANAGTGPWPVTDNGGSLTVDTTQLPGSLVSGRLDVNIGASSATVPVSAVSLPLPTGAATSALQTTGNTTLSTINGKIPALGQATMANSSPVAIASDQSSIPVTDGGGSLTVDGTVTANAGTGPWPVTDNGGSITVDSDQLPAALVGGRLDVTLGTALPTGANVIGALTANQTVNVNQIAGTAVSVNSGAANAGTQRVVLATNSPVNVAQMNGVNVTMGNGTSGTGVQRVTLASDSTGQVALATASNSILVDNAAFTDGTSRVNAAGYIFDEVAGTALTENDIAAARIDSKRAQVFVIEDGTTRGERATVTGGRLLVDSVRAASATPAQSSVGTSTANATLLAANANRRIATVYNDSSSLMYLKLGATASSTSFSVRMAPQSYYEVPAGYTGAVHGILNTGTGNARLTEITA